MILSGLLTEPLLPEPFLSWSTKSMPETTWPQIVYCPSRNGAGAKQMKNWLLAVFGLCVRAAPTVPRRKCAESG